MRKTNWIFLVFCIASFVIQSLLVQKVQSKYYKPFFLLYLAHSSYIIFLPTTYIYYKSKGYTFKEYKKIKDDLQSQLPRFGVPLNPIHYWKRILTLTIIFTMTSLFWYFSVSKISLGDITAIYNTSCFFVYLLSLLFLREKFLWSKLFAVIISVAGIGFISFFSQRQSIHATKVIGYTFAILSSLCAAMYEVLYSMIAVPKNPSVFFSLYVTGSIGLMTMVVGSFIFPIFHFTGIEEFILPPLDAWPWIGLVCLLGLAFNSLFLLVISVAGPVFAAVGILVCIPLTSISDYVVNSKSIGWNVITGSICILLGFALLQIKSKSEPLDEEQPLLE